MDQKIKKKNNIGKDYICYKSIISIFRSLERFSTFFSAGQEILFKFIYLHSVYILSTPLQCIPIKIFTSKRGVGKNNRTRKRTES